MTEKSGNENENINENEYFHSAWWFNVDAYLFRNIELDKEMKTKFKSTSSVGQNRRRMNKKEAQFRIPLWDIRIELIFYYDVRNVTFSFNFPSFVLIH